MQQENAFKYHQAELGQRILEQFDKILSHYDNTSRNYESMDANLKNISKAEKANECKDDTKLQDKKVHQFEEPELQLMKLLNQNANKRSNSRGSSEDSSGE